ncbi:MAG: redox-sensing transcriptional repressor Rex [Chitinispirillales bacterium]|nr:redox-sensing transcriptional repressor Rex [Chitinispirillales bacterium]
MIPNASIERLSMIYNLLEQLEIIGDNGEMISHISSGRIGEIIGIPPHTIRKDINFLSDVGRLGKGYPIKGLRTLIAEKLCLTKRKAAIVGLGKIGSAILEHERFFSAGVEIAAGFDSDINRIDIIKTKIPLFASREITEVIQNKNIEIAFLTSSPESAKVCFERLEAGGVKAILNFTPTILASEKIHIRNIDLVLETTILSAMIGLNDNI